MKSFILCLVTLIALLCLTGTGRAEVDLDIPDLVQHLGGLKIVGKGYFYYHHDASQGDGQTNSFDFARLYMGAKYHISDEFSVEYLTDIAHHDKTGKLEVYTKYAYVDWSITNKLNLVMGLQGTSNWKQPEKAWGYRSIHKAPMEAFGGFCLRQAGW